MTEDEATAKAFADFGITDDVVETAVRDLLYLDAILGFDTSYPHLRKFGFRLPKHLHEHSMEVYEGLTTGRDDNYHKEILHDLIADVPTPVVP